MDLNLDLGIGDWGLRACRWVLATAQNDDKARAIILAARFGGDKAHSAPPITADAGPGLGNSMSQQRCTKLYAARNLGEIREAGGSREGGTQIDREIFRYLEERRPERRYCILSRRATDLRRHRIALLTTIRCRPGRPGRPGPPWSQ